MSREQEQEKEQQQDLPAVTVEINFLLRITRLSSFSGGWGPGWRAFKNSGMALTTRRALNP